VKLGEELGDITRSVDLEQGVAPEEESTANRILLLSPIPGKIARSLQDQASIFNHAVAHGRYLRTTWRSVPFLLQLTCDTSPERVHSDSPMTFPLAILGWKYGVV
jgi:hypothetical protein